MTLQSHCYSVVILKYLVTYDYIIFFIINYNYMFLEYIQTNEVTKPYFDDDNMSSSEDASDLEFIKPSTEWKEETAQEHG